MINNNNNNGIDSKCIYRRSLFEKLHRKKFGNTSLLSFNDFLIICFCSALVTYNTDIEDMPASRDALFISVLSAVISESLVSELFDLQKLYENLLALVALEEAIGIREPRASCKDGYREVIYLSYTLHQ